MFYPKKTYRFEVRGTGHAPFFTEDCSKAYDKAEAWSKASRHPVYVIDNDEDTKDSWAGGFVFYTIRYR